jgi:hypothetical protein
MHLKSLIRSIFFRLYRAERQQVTPSVAYVSLILTPVYLVEACRRRSKHTARSALSSARRLTNAKSFFVGNRTRSENGFVLTAQIRSARPRMIIQADSVGKANGPKIKQSQANPNAFLCDNYAKSATRDSGERGEEHHSR